MPRPVFEEDESNGDNFNLNFEENNIEKLENLILSFIESDPNPEEEEWT